MPRNGPIEFHDFLPPPLFHALRQEALGLTGVERSYVPTHKQGGTVAFDTLCCCAPDMTAYYRSTALHQQISAALDCQVRPTPQRDQSSLSLLVYDRPGDQIGWHRDLNFYRGRHFTLLVPLVNVGFAAGQRSHARLSVREPGQPDRVVDTGANHAVLFEGAHLLHSVSRLLAGERRIVLSMTFCSDSHATFSQGVARRIKDTAFFGLRALWT